MNTPLDRASACKSQRRKAVGFRNLAVHSYSSIDWAIVHAIATRHLDDFARLADWIRAQG
ncbi:MAG TPA: HepT-like ribonuclease domain-containing protein [Rhodanobacter sp.]|nr:HepT-like ribonuclease domain-containing protein [Rhodanobacter sp.]